MNVVTSVFSANDLLVQQYHDIIASPKEWGTYPAIFDEQRTTSGWPVIKSAYQLLMSEICSRITWTDPTVMWSQDMTRKRWSKAEKSYFSTIYVVVWTDPETPK